jgi:uncharacterized membrane protein
MADVVQEGFGGARSSFDLEVDQVRAAIVEPEILTVAPARVGLLALVVWSLTSILALAILALIVTAPVFETTGFAGFSAWIYYTFSFVCHQIPERSFHIAGHQFAVCSRCTGLYTGFAVASLLYPLAPSLNRTDTPRRIWLILAAAPLAIDFALGYFSIWQNTYLSRFVTGALLSSVAVFYVMPGLIELAKMIAGRFTRRQIV